MSKRKYELKVHYIGNGLYKVFIDGKYIGAPCEIDRVAMMYDDMVGDSDGNNEYKNGTACAV